MNDRAGEAPQTDVDDEGAQTTTGYSWYALGVLTLCFAFAQLDRISFNILIEPMKRDFGASDTQMGLLAGLAFVLFYTVFGVPVARYADRGNRKLLLSISVTAWSLMTVVTGFATNVFQAGAARIGLGIAEAGCLPASMSMIPELFPKERRAFASSILQGGMALGALIGGPIVGIVAETHGWRWAMWTLGVPGIALGVLVHFTIREPRIERAKLAAAKAAQDGLADDKPKSSVWADSAMLMRDRRFALLLACQLFVGLAVGVNIVWWTVLMQRDFGIDLQEVAIYAGGYFGIVLLIGYLSGGYLTTRMIARKGEQYFGALIPGLAAVASVPFGVAALLADSLQTSSILSVFFFFLLFVSRPAGNTLAVEFAPASQRGLAVSLMLLATNLVGAGGGPLLVGLISDALSPSMGEVEALRLGIICTVPVGVLFSGLLYLMIARVVARSQAASGPETASLQAG
jgi:MFS family permease